MNDLIVFEERELLGKQFRIYGTPQEPLFLAKDIAEWIDYDTSSVNKMISNIDEDEKVRNNLPTLGGNQEAWFLTENGLYEVLMQSRKPIAKQFKQQVKEILKSIRKYGMYAKDELLDNPQLLYDVVIKLKEEREIRKQIEEENQQLKPLAELAEQVCNADGLFNFKQVADTFGYGRNTLMKILRQEKVLSENDNYKNLPYSQYRKNGMFIVKIAPRKTTEGLVDICTTLCTPKSFKLIKRILDKKKDLLEQVN